MDIENGWLSEEYVRPVTHCDRCKEYIYPGDTFYQLEGENICPQCLEDWAEQYAVTAEEGEEYG